jgi:hypothetical protein
MQHLKNTPRSTLPARSHIAIALSLMLGSSAWALDNPDFSLIAGVGVQSDSNPLRASSGADRSDQISTLTLGASVNLHDSLQDLRANVSFQDYRYKTFSGKNLTAVNYEAQWGWAFTPRLTGQLTADRKELPSYSADNGRIVDSATRLDAVYEVDGPWRLLAGASSSRSSGYAIGSNGAQTSDPSNYGSADVGVRYVFASDTSLSYSVIVSDGQYLDRTPDGRFKQVENDFRMHWMISEGSSADANLTSIRRSHTSDITSDFNGWNSGASLNWALSGKTNLAMSYGRSLGSIAVGASIYPTQSEQWSIGPVWQMTSKTRLSLRQGLNVVDYLGSSTSPLGAQRRDTSHDTSVTLNWMPSPAWTLTAMLQAVSRSSNADYQDYQASLASVSIVYSY